MTERDFKEFSRALTLVAEIYGRDISEPLTRLYFECLKHYTLEEVLSALRAHITLPTHNGRFFPRPADISLLIEGDPDTQAAIAWCSLCRAIEDHGGYTSIAFDDPVVHMCIQEMGGWLQLCEMKESELPFREKEFCRLYRYYSLHPRKDYPAYFPGRIELENTSRGFHEFLPPVVHWSISQSKTLALGSGTRPVGSLPEKDREVESHDQPAGCRG